MELVDKVGEVISFLVGATGGGDLAALVEVMLVGVEVNRVRMIGTAWTGVDEGVDVDGLTIEEKFLTETEAEVAVVALKEFEHGTVAAEAVAEAEVGVGAGAGVVVEVAAGLVVVVAATAVALAHVGVAAIAVAVEVTAAAAVPSMLGVIGHLQSFLIRRILWHQK